MILTSVFFERWLLSRWGHTLLSLLRMSVGLCKNVLFASIKMITWFFKITLMLLTLFFLFHILELSNNAHFVIQKSLLQLHCGNVPWICARLPFELSSLKPQIGSDHSYCLSGGWVRAAPLAMGSWNHWELLSFCLCLLCSLFLPLPPSWIP